ncbi:MAG TPA: alpha/beta hydrolase [Candidatus Binatia bacterium]|nr:alpha/beta hydrolase [Candidatus Binatia bacterium]
MRIERDLTYTPADWPAALEADVYRPAANGPFPAVLLVHPGAWAHGSRSDMDDIGRLLARRGFVAVDIEYRLAPQWHFPAPLQDLQQAMHWIHAHARAHDIDEARIGAFGYSAGGHLAALLAMLRPGDALDSPYGGPDTRLRALVAGAAPADLTLLDGGGLTESFLGVTPRQDPQRYVLASPVSHVHAGAPPVFLYHGAVDDLVPVEHAQRFRAALAAVGVHSELYRIPLLGHVSVFLLADSALDAALEFLDRTLR